MRCNRAVFLATLVVGLSQMALSQEPISKGTWAYKNGKPESVTIDYGTKLTTEDIERLSAVDSMARISMGYAGIDSEYVTIEGDLLNLGGLKNLEVVYLNQDGIVDDDLKFIALLPRIHELEFNAKNGEGGCTDRCADHLSAAKTLRELRIYNGQFTDKFVARITQGLPNLEELMLSSPELTDESLRLIAERCKKLKSLSIGSKHFTCQGLKHLDKLPNLKERSVSSPSLRWANVADSWLLRAEAACNEIEDGDAADLAFARLQAVYIKWGEIEKAEKITQRIKKRERRVRAHIAIARHYAETGNVERCKLELNLVKPLAVKTRLTGDELVEAYLHLAESPSLAISFMTGEQADPWARKKLCQALARHGYLDEALKIADSEMDVNEQNELKLTAAIAAAKAARIADTEKATQNLAVSYLAQQNIWGQLAAALYKKKDLQSARQYAARVNSSYIKRTNGYLRRIADNLPPNTPNISTYAFPPKKTKLSLTIPLPSEDPNAANRLLESVIADAEENPIESTEGQFGPWNQQAHLARIRMQYALVAALYRKAGNQEQATRKMQFAEAAIETLTEENAWAAQIAFLEMQGTLVSLEDIEGLKRLAMLGPLSSWATDAIVPEIFSSGDIERAKNLAKTALSGQAANGNRRNGRSEMVSCFINAGKVEAAHEILKTSKPGDFTAAACQNAGRAMMQMDGGQLLRTSKWRVQIDAFQRAHLYIGAAIMAKENSNANG